MSVPRFDESVPRTAFERSPQAGTPRLGPYETAYETRRGYEAPPVDAPAPRAPVAWFSGREMERRR
jgi:hypothetical protein